MKPSAPLFLVCAISVSLFAAEKQPTGSVAADAGVTGPIRWLAFPAPQFEVRGLPWFAENAPELWRLPKSAQSHVPKGVWARAIAPDGGRIRFASTTSRLAIRIQVVGTQKKLAHFDAYIGDELAGSAGSPGRRTTEIELFAGKNPQGKTLTIYLPNTTEGLQLFGAADKARFNDPLHPNDAGNERMGDRLVPLVKSAVLGRQETGDRG